MHKDHPSILHKPLISLESFLEDFVSSQNMPACIKTPGKIEKIGKFAVCNAVIAERDGIELQDYIGLTCYDVGEKMSFDPSIMANITDVDTKIFNGVIPYAQYKQSMPTDCGLFCIEEVIKRPVFSKNNKIIGLLSCGGDITHRVDPLYLFSKYIQQYTIKEAIRHFLRHMKIQHFFYALPTKRELETLLIMRGSNTTKYIAQVMQLSPKTIEENKARLRNNLKLITLNDLVAKLRVRGEFQDAYTDY